MIRTHKVFMGYAGKYKLVWNRLHSSDPLSYGYTLNEVCPTLHFCWPKVEGYLDECALEH